MCFEQNLAIATAGYGGFLQLKISLDHIPLGSSGHTPLLVQAVVYAAWFRAFIKWHERVSSWMLFFGSQLALNLLQPIGF